jgi:hypothetical protein
MSKQVQFKVSIIAATISMMMAGGAMADAGNTLVGPNVDTTGVATVKIDQSGTGNTTSATGAINGGAFIVDQSAGATTLTIQQVGTDNTLGLSSFTNAVTSIQVFQGADAVEGNTGHLGEDATKTVDSNAATIEIGQSTTNRNEATDVFLSQQGDFNVAGLHLGNTAGVFTGTLNLLQIGASNIAAVTINGQTTTDQTFNIGQSGPSNTLALDVFGNQTAGMTLDFGGVTFGQATSLPAVTNSVGLNNASTYTYTALGANAGLKTLFDGSSTGINVQGTDAFRIKALGGANNVQVDLSNAKATGNKIDVNLNDGASKFAVYGLRGATVNLGGAAALNVENSKELVAYADGASANLSVNGVTFNGNGYFSTGGTGGETPLSGGSITMSGGTVNATGLSVLQSGAAHTFSSTNGSSSVATWNVAQTGSVVSSITANNTAADTTGSSFALTQTSETAGGADAMTLNNSGANTAWTATQTGAGAKTLVFTNSTPGATISATQTGANTQSATGIDFAAASGTFTLVQR